MAGLIMWPMYLAVGGAMTGVFGLLGGLWGAGKIEIDTGPLSKRNESSSRIAPAIFVFPHQNVSEANMQVLNGMVHSRISSTEHKGHNALFHNRAKNFMGEGVMMGLETVHNHGLRHGKIFAPIGANNEVVEGKWLAAHPHEADEATVNAFATLQRSFMGFSDSEPGDEAAWAAIWSLLMFP